MQQISTKEYKTWNDWVGSVLLKLCKKMKFDHTNEGYMHNPESVLENEMHKLLWILRHKRTTLILPDNQTL